MAALRPERRRALREDGPQRHRVRAHGRLRRGPQRARQGRHRHRGPCRRRRDGAAHPPGVLPLRARPGRDHRGVAAGLGRRQLAARPHRRGARRRPRARRRSRAGSATPARAAGRSARRSTRASPCRYCRPRCSNGSAHGAGRTSPTRCCRRCGPASAVTSRGARAADERPWRFENLTSADRPMRSSCSARPATSPSASCSRRSTTSCAAAS